MYRTNLWCIFFQDFIKVRRLDVGKGGPEMWLEVDVFKTSLTIDFKIYAQTV